MTISSEYESYLVCVEFDVSEWNKISFAYTRQNEQELARHEPRFPSRIERRFEPTQCAFVKLIINADGFDVRQLLVDLNGVLAALLVD